MATCKSCRYNEVQDMEVDFFTRECLTHENVLSGVPQWLADLSTARGLPGLDVAALLIQKLARKASKPAAGVLLPTSKPKPQEKYDSDGWLID